MAKRSTQATKRARKHPWPRPFKYPRLGTAAARDFWVSFEQINLFADYILRLALAVENAMPPILRGLRDAARSPEERRELERQMQEWRGPLAELAAHRQFFSEVFLCRHIDNFLSYLSGVLFDIFTARPEALKSSEKVDFDFVLSHGSLQSLVRGLAERKVETLSYASFERLAEFFADQFHLEICPAKHQPFLKESIEIRNLSVHNRCIVNRRYLERVPTSAYKLGELRALSVLRLDKLVPLLHSSVRELDRAARRHLKLPGVRFNVPELIRQGFEEEYRQYKARQSDTSR